jgi:hypothetical protein
MNAYAVPSHVCIEMPHMARPCSSHPWLSVPLLPTPYTEPVFSNVYITTYFKQKTPSQRLGELIFSVFEHPYKSTCLGTHCLLPRESIQEIKHMRMMYFMHGLFLTCTQKISFIFTDHISWYDKCTIITKERRTLPLTLNRAAI